VGGQFACRAKTFDSPHAIGRVAFRTCFTASLSPMKESIHTDKTPPADSQDAADTNLRRRLFCRTRSKVRGLLERRVDILLRRAVAKVPLRVCADFHRDLETIVVSCKRPISALDDGLLA
jgi:hypothetical protein